MHTVIFLTTGDEMDTLTTCFYGLFGGELFMCCMIKRLKLKNTNIKMDENEQIAPAQKDDEEICG